METPTIDDVSHDEPVDGSEQTDVARRRPVDHTSLIAGVVVLAIAAAFAFGDPDSLRDQGRVMGPLVLLGVGAALLVGSLKR